jgi:hypothetical protein
MHEPLHPAGEHLLNPLSWRGLAVVGATFRRLLAFPATANFATNRFYLWISHASFDPAVWSGPVCVVRQASCVGPL